MWYTKDTKMKGANENDHENELLLLQVGEPEDRQGDPGQLRLGQQLPLHRGEGRSSKDHLHGDQQGRVRRPPLQGILIHDDAGPPEAVNPGRKEARAMKRYEVRQISINWFGIWDTVMKEFVIESTGYGIGFYRKLFDC